MSVVIETTLGDLTVDLFVTERPRACLNFIKLCKLKYYNYNLFHTVQHGFIAQSGDPTGAGDGGESLWGVLEGSEKRYFEGESQPKIKHTDVGLLSMVSSGDNMIGSQFFFTLDSDLSSLDAMHCVIGEVAEGHDVLRLFNEAICDSNHRPYQDIRITHTVILEDPFNDPTGFTVPSRSPSPSVERLKGGRIAPDEAIDETEGKSEREINEMIQEREAKARATILEIVGDLPDADMAPPENVLFICKLNPVTNDDDLEIIFSRFGTINSCEVIRDKISGDSLQYAFVEFDNQKSCEDAYFKMDNVLIDDRRIHVDFSQSVSKIKWRGKGRGVIHLDNNKEELKGTKADSRNHLAKRPSPEGRSNRSRSPRYNYHSRDSHHDGRNKNSRNSNRRSRSKEINTSSASRDKRRYRTPRSENRDKINQETNQYRSSKKQRSRSPVRNLDRKRNDSLNRSKRTRSPERSRKNDRTAEKKARSRSRSPRYGRYSSTQSQRTRAPESKDHGYTTIASKDSNRSRKNTSGSKSPENKHVDKKAKQRSLKRDAEENNSENSKIYAVSKSKTENNRECKKDKKDKYTSPENKHVKKSKKKLEKSSSDSDSSSEEKIKKKRKAGKDKKKRKKAKKASSSSSQSSSESSDSEPDTKKKRQKPKK